MKRAVFLDRDGVLNVPIVHEGKPFPPQTVADFVLYPEAVASCSLLRQAGFLLVVVTNQPDVGRGTQTLDQVEAMHAALNAVLPIDRIEVCTAGSSDDPGSHRRKPAPGMLLEAAAALSIDLGRSYMVGDRWRDVDCGQAAGCRTIFLDRGYTESLRQKPDFVVKNLAEAAHIILQDSAFNGTLSL